MISILIPTYNYDCTELVRELVNQCESTQIKYEIICQDDASQSKLNLKNTTINSIQFCHFHINSTNLGRSKNRNDLAQKSTYNWLLFLDCDTMPVDRNFIQKYISVIQNNETAVAFGGIQYQDSKPQKEHLLRWVFGKKREALNVDERQIKGNYSALTSNLLVKKEVFTFHPFDEELTQYGYEDYAFFSALQKANQTVIHVENPCFHLGLESSVEFLEKTKIAVQNLVQLAIYKNDLVAQNKIVKTHKTLTKWKLQYVMVVFFSLAKKIMERNLQSSFPSLFIFDLYKLGWFSTLLNNQARK